MKEILTILLRKDSPDYLEMRDRMPSYSRSAYISSLPMRESDYIEDNSLLCIAFVLSVHSVTAVILYIISIVV